MKRIKAFFKIDELGSSFKKEILGGIVAFIAGCYIIPLNSVILNGMGMDKAGVFAITAILSAALTILMGVLGKVPWILCTGMSVNSFIVYTVSQAQGFTWQQSLIILTMAGILFLTLSLTPLRKKVIDSIPPTLKAVISACLGAFIAFVGLKSSFLVVPNGGTLVTFGSLANPGVLISALAILLVVALLFSRKEMLSNLAIPIGVLIATVVGLIVSSIMIGNGSMFKNASGEYVYNVLGNEVEATLPIAPWITKEPWGASGINKVFLFGAFDSYSGDQFAKDIATVLKSPFSYIAMFSVIFIEMFDSTATMLSLGGKAGIFDENGNIIGYRRLSMPDAIGAAFAGPLGTSAVTPLAESGIAMKAGAKTGFSSIVAGLLLLSSAFIFPIFSIFTSKCISAPALFCIGGIICTGAFKSLDLKDFKEAFILFAGIIFSVVTYSIINGIGIAFFIYIIVNLISGDKKKVTAPVIIIGSLFLISMVLTAITPLFK